MSQMDVARRTIWNRHTYNAVRDLIRRERPDIVHCTNTFPLVSPAIYHAAYQEKVPVVQGLRNYRTLCLNALFLRDGKVCEDCLGRILPWPGVVHGCYRGDRWASAVVATMSGMHRLLRTWNQKVTLFFAPSEFARQKFIQGGLPAHRIVVKMNSVFPDPGPGDGQGNYAVFVGRLSEEKGLNTLLKAWAHLREPLPLTIIGDGPMSQQVLEASQQDPRVVWLGRKARDEVLAIIGRASCLVMPSICYETFGRTIVESFAKGTPVIASRLGAMAERVEDGHTGLLFEPGNAVDLVAKLQLHLSDPARMRRAARQEFEKKYQGEQNYAALTAIYQQALSLLPPEREPRSSARIENESPRVHESPQFEICEKVS
jgi:glycosyltransferase involved in cell wall biosynthesis